jgi:hypothetical protein
MIMKMRGLFLTIAIFAAMFSANAQWVATPVDGTPANDPTGNFRDTVSIGSQSRYRVNSTMSSPSSYYNTAGFIWANTGGYTLYKADGTTTPLTPFAPVDPDGAVNDSSIVIIPSATGTFNVTVAEKSRPKFGLGCVGSTQTTEVEVIALPAAAYGVDSGACALPVTIPLPVTFTGYGNYQVTFSVQAYNMADVAQGAAVTVNMDNLYNIRTKGTQSYARVQLATATFPALASGGYYVITMTNLQDRISKKTLGYNFGTVNVANANPDAADDYRYYLYPTPTTQPIQHIQNF